MPDAATGARRIKVLEVEDFKTFYGRHVLQWLEPFIALLGPNGGGKSNLLDAVAFVLGAKVTALRAREGRDLIHRGRRALTDGDDSDSPTASVTAVFTLFNGGEMVFKRAVSDAGSEFMVQGETVTLKIYQKRLENLGINMNFCNFMVFQGTVENIAMGTSSMRTKLIEEISGSGALSRNYKLLKNELVKAEEVVKGWSEKFNWIKNECKQLKAYVDNEEEYKRLEQQCETMKIKLELFRLYHVAKKLKTSEEEAVTRENDLEQVQKKERKQAELVEKKLQDVGVDVQDAAKLEQNWVELEAIREKKRMELQAMKEYIAKTKRKKDMFVRLLSKAQESREAHQRKVEELVQMLKELETEAAQYEERLAQEALMKGTSVELEGEQLPRYYQLKQQAGQHCFLLQQEVDCLSRQLKPHHDQLANENRQLEEGRQAFNRKKEEVEAAKRRMERLKESLEENTQSMDERQRVLNEIKEGVTQKTGRLEQLRDELKSLTEELNEVTWTTGQASRLKDKMEIVEQMQEMFPGVHDRLKNLCKPIHPRYQLAITRVFVKHFDSIVVDTEATARKCIEYLSERMKNRETFLPLDYLHAEPLKDRLRTLQQPQHVKLAFDLIKFQCQEIRVAVLFVTKSTLVCETYEDAMTLANEMGHDAVAVDGTFFSKWGLITGGQVELEGKAKVWSEKKVAKLRKDKDRVMGELRQAQHLTKEVSEMKFLEAQVRGQEAKVRYASVEVDRLLKEIKEMENQHRRLEEELNTLTDSCKLKEAALAGKSTEIKGKQEEMKVAEDEIFVDFCREIGVSDIREFEEQDRSVLMGRTEKRLFFDKQKSRIISLLDYEKSRDMEGEVERSERAISKQTEALEKIKEDEKEKMKDFEAAIRESTKCKAKQVKKGQAVREAEEGAEAARKAARRMKREKDKAQNTLESTRKQIASLKFARLTILKHCHIKSLQLPLLSGCLREVLERATDTSIASADISNLTTPSSRGTESSPSLDLSEENIKFNFASLSKTYKEIETDEPRKKMDEKIVNEINEMEKTLSTMQKPKSNTLQYLRQVKHKANATGIHLKDSQNLASDAKDAFQQVQEQRYRLFMRCFTPVSTKIDEVYKDLYGRLSAQALLEADNSAEPYLGSIVYHTIPPGKRCQANMANLSGGEKAMASLAFLFALHSYRPAPFFLLDEVDAALDRANIRKVAAYMCRRKEEVQSIVISHKEDLYREADVLLGVTSKTRNDYARSRIYSLDLTQYRGSRHRRRRSEDSRRHVARQQHTARMEDIEEAVVEVV